MRSMSSLKARHQTVMPKRTVALPREEKGGDKEVGSETNDNRPTLLFFCRTKVQMISDSPLPNAFR